MLRLLPPVALPPGLLRLGDVAHGGGDLLGRFGSGPGSAKVPGDQGRRDGALAVGADQGAAVLVDCPSSTSALSLESTSLVRSGSGNDTLPSPITTGSGM